MGGEGGSEGVKRAVLGVEKGLKGGSEASEEALGRLEGLHPAMGRGGGPDPGAAAMLGKDEEGGRTRPNEAPEKKLKKIKIPPCMIPWDML